MNDENYYCKRCKEPFSHLKSQANAFEDQFEENGRAMSQHDHAVDGAIVQLECNPAHVFHAECIESFAFCPECFVPINNSMAANTSQMDERSVGPPRSDCDSQEEDLLDMNQDSDQENNNNAHDAEDSRRRPIRTPTIQVNGTNL